MKSEAIAPSNSRDTTLELVDTSKLTFDLHSGDYAVKANYQKKIDVTSGSITGVEIFGRLKDKNGGLYSPALFIPELKKTDQLDLFTWELFNHVINDWQANLELDSKLSLSINIDLESLSNTSFIQRLEIRSKDFSQYTEVFLDINYKQLLNADKEQIDNLIKLRECRYKIAIELDEFDTSIDAILDKLPISEVKLKRHFIKHALSTAKVEQALSPVILASSKFSVPVTVIGIETEAEYELVKDLGIKYIQGYYFGHDKNNNKVISEILNQLPNHTEKNNSGKLVCFSSNADATKIIEHLFESKLEKEFYPLNNDDITDIEIESNTIVLFDLAASEEINIAKSILKKFEQEIISLVMLPNVDDLNAKLELFDLGAYDVLEKPVTPTEVLTKVDRMSSFIMHRQEVIEKLEETETIAFQSMQDASSYGEIVQFMKKVSSCTSDTEIGNVFFNYMSGQNLNCSIYFTDCHTEQAFSSNECVSPPTEFKLFNLLRGRDRLHEFGNRLIVNDKNVSFLIKNMPSDEVLRGRIRDYVAVIVECIQEKQDALIKASVINAAVLELAHISNESMDVIKTASMRRKVLIEKVCEDISTSFDELDLSLEQEDHLTGIIRDALDASEEDDISISNLVNRVSQVTEKLEDVSRSSSENNPVTETQDESVVELF